MATEKYIQAGTMALRAPDGSFLPSVPLYIRAEDAGGVNPSTGMTIAEEIAAADISTILAREFDEYRRDIEPALGVAHISESKNATPFLIPPYDKPLYCFQSPTGYPEGMFYVAVCKFKRR